MPLHHPVNIGQAPVSAPVAQLRPFTLQRLDPLRRLWRAQDSLPSQSRRVLAEYALSGSLQWAVPVGTVDPNNGVLTYPRNDLWRSVGTFRSRLTPGCQLEAHVMFCPAGLVQRFNGGWESDGAYGQLRINVTWTAGGSSSGPHQWTVAMPGEVLGPYGGLQREDFGENWNILRERIVEQIFPPGYDTDDDVAATYSEGAEVEIELQVLGGERVVHATVYEVPSRHVQRHDDVGPFSVHGAPAFDAPFPVSVRTDAPDAAVFENHRQGTVRTLSTAVQQQRTLGPKIVSWAYVEHDLTPDNVPSLDFGTLTGGSAYSHMFDTSQQGWRPEDAGWIVACSTAQVYELTGAGLFLQGRRAVVPVTVRVDADWSGGGTSYGELRLQSGEYEWVDVRFESDQVREVRTVYGWLESQVHGDHAAANLVPQVFNSGTLFRIFGIDVEWGHG